MRFRLNPVAFSLLCAFAPLAFAGGDNEPTLQLDYTLINSSKNHPGKSQEETPVFISAQQMEGKKDAQIEASGGVELRKRGEAVYADHVLYLLDSKYR